MTPEFLNQTIAKAVYDTYEIEPAKLEISPANPEHGDFACNVAFGLAKLVGVAPLEIATKLAAAISHDMIDDVSAAVPGYINIRLTDNYWREQLSQITSTYGQSTVQAGKKIQVEFISANPTGPLTMANARGGYLGDVLCNVLASQGYDVTREYYINDAGNQIKKLADSVRFEAGIPIEGERQYSGSYISELASTIKPTLEMEPGQLEDQANIEIISMIKSSVAKMGIEFDEWFSERSLLEHTVGVVMDKLKSLELVYEKDGATWLASSKFGDDRDRVLIKSTGENVYLLNDLAYHYDIFKNRQFASAIKIWGADHGGQVASLKLGVQQLVPESELNFILLQLVRIIKDGQEFKSSKRAGTYITMEDLLDEIPSDVARFFFLQRSADSPMDFDLDLAKEQSQKNPLYYVMYSYARACSILRQASERKLKPMTQTESLRPLERRLTQLMNQLPGLLMITAQDYGVHRLTFYGQELAKLFHDLYESERIIGLEPHDAAQRLYVVKQYTVFMNRYFELLGITPMDRMDSSSLA